MGNSTKQYLIDAIRELIEHDSTSEEIILGWLNTFEQETYEDGYKDGIAACQGEHI